MPRRKLARKSTYFKRRRQQRDREGHRSPPSRATTSEEETVLSQQVAFDSFFKFLFGCLYSIVKSRVLSARAYICM